MAVLHRYWVLFFLILLTREMLSYWFSSAIAKNKCENLFCWNSLHQEFLPSVLVSSQLQYYIVCRLVLLIIKRQKFRHNIIMCLVFFAVDITVYRNGYHGDLNETFYVGEVDEGAKRLVQTTYECLMQAIDAGKPSCCSLKFYSFGSQTQVLIFGSTWEWFLLQNTEVLVCISSRWHLLYNTLIIFNDTLPYVVVATFYFKCGFTSEM